MEDMPSQHRHLEVSIPFVISSSTKIVVLVVVLVLLWFYFYRGQGDEAPQVADDSTVASVESDNQDDQDKDPEVASTDCGSDTSSPQVSGGGPDNKQ